MTRRRVAAAMLIVNRLVGERREAINRLVGRWREKFSLWWLGRLFSERREFSWREVTTSNSSCCADSDKLRVTNCLYREKHPMVVGNPCNGTVQVRYGWMMVLYMLQHVLARSGEKWCNIERH